MDFQTWLDSVQSSLSASNHPTPASAYNLADLSRLHQQGVSPVIAARQLVARQVPMNPIPTSVPVAPLATSPFPPATDIARNRLEFARVFCVLAGWITWAVGGGYVLIGMITMGLSGMSGNRGVAAALGFLMAAAPVVGGLLVMGAGGVLLVVGYGTKLMLDIHEKIVLT